MKKFLIILQILTLLGCSNFKAPLDDFKVTINENGDTISIETRNSSGKLDGALILFDSLGQRNNKSIIRNGMKVDSIISYYTNGMVSSIDYIIEPCDINNCCCDGLVHVYDSLGNISSIYERKNGETFGFIQKYFDGKLKIKGEILNGIKHGAQYVFHDNGSLKLKRTYKNGIIDGVEYTYLEDGTIEFITNFKDGIKNGYCIEIYENYIIEGYYYNDLEEGNWTQHHYTNDTIFVRKYKKGKVIKEYNTVANTSYSPLGVGW